MNTTQSRLNKLIKNISKDFSLDKLSKSPARFDLQKLTWFNRQYIQMMSLDEFVTRAFELKLSARIKDVKLRVGDYVYLVDLNSQKTFTQYIGFSKNGVNELWYHQLGGGREIDEDSNSCIVREALEETDGKLTLDPTKLVKISTLQCLYDEPRECEDPDTKGRAIYDGIEQNVYFYEFDQSDFPEYTNLENEKFEWIDLNVVLAKNDCLTYPVWKQFCKTNNVKLVEPNEAILMQYLAWQLDKNRVNLLTEIDSESDCITNWIKPTQEEVSWKKITKEESLSNLDEIKNHIEILYKSSDLNIKTKQEELYSKVKNEIYFENSREIESGLAEMTSKWENLLKTWISENGKDAGSYFWPLRVALSGKQKSPSPFEILSILSLEEVVNRINKVLA